MRTSTFLPLTLTIACGGPDGNGPDAGGPAPTGLVPRLHFTDITSGPADGLGDGLGQGAIVTVWGVGLGAAQGASTVTACDRPVAHVYHWGDATPQPGHPANLYAYQWME